MLHSAHALDRYAILLFPLFVLEPLDSSSLHTTLTTYSQLLQSLTFAAPINPINPSVHVPDPILQSQTEAHRASTPRTYRIQHHYPLPTTTSIYIPNLLDTIVFTTYFCNDGLMDTVTVKEAAQQLGITEQSVRKRISVGTLDSYKDDDNRVHVYLPDTTTSTTDYQAIYVQSLEAQISFLKDQLEDEKLASSELRRILYVQANRPPHQLEQPTEPSESSDTPTSTGLLRRLFRRRRR